jgi:hypothetical protein
MDLQPVDQVSRFGLSSLQGGSWRALAGILVLLMAVAVVSFSWNYQFDKPV